MNSSCSCPEFTVTKPTVWCAPWHRSPSVSSSPATSVIPTSPPSVATAWPGFIEAERKTGKQITSYEYAVLVTNLTHEVLSLGQPYRYRADCENTFDELKNQWGWGGCTTHDLHRRQLSARAVALIYNWWRLFVRLASPEAITSRPWLMSSIGRRTEHAGQTTLT